MSEDTELAQEFDTERARLVALAYRMLGSTADAEDAVQEAWFRLARQDADAIDNLPGWLTTVVGRVCLDLLRSRRTHPESALDERLPDFVVTEDEGGPEDTALLADSVGLALLVVLDTLRPDERLAFVLHDMFAALHRDRSGHRQVTRCGEDAREPGPPQGAGRSSLHRRTSAAAGGRRRLHRGGARRGL